MVGWGLLNEVLEAATGLNSGEHNISLFPALFPRLVDDATDHAWHLGAATFTQSLRVSEVYYAAL